MGKKKGKKSGKSKKKGKASKTPAIDPAITRAIAKADEEAVKKRLACANAVTWVDVAKNWFERNRASAFDALRNLDSSRSGKVSVTVFQSALENLKIPLKTADIETLSGALDFEDKNEVEYCCLPKMLNCYGGGLHELVLKGLERVMMDYRQDLAEIEERHKSAIAEIHNAAELAKAPISKTEDEVDDTTATDTHDDGRPENQPSDVPANEDDNDNDNNDNNDEDDNDNDGNDDDEDEDENDADDAE